MSGCRAHRSLCGLIKARAYASDCTRSLALRPQHMRFKVGHKVAQIVVIITIVLPQNDHSHIPLKTDVFDLGISLIVGWTSWNPTPVGQLHRKRMKLRILNISRPLTYKHGHFFLEWDPHRILFTWDALPRLYLQFMHPAVELLLELIKKANPEEATKSVRDLLS